MKTIEKKAEEFANTTWDESGLPLEERTEESQLELCKVCARVGYQAGYKEAEPKWIQLEKQEPQKGQWVLICEASNSLSVTIGRWQGDCFLPDTDNISGGEWEVDSIVGTTHWMPLPETPKGEE